MIEVQPGEYGSLQLADGFTHNGVEYVGTVTWSGRADHDRAAPFLAFRLYPRDSMGDPVSEDGVVRYFNPATVLSFIPEALPEGV